VSTAQDQPAVPAAEVSVTFDGCPKEDVRAVLAALHTTFPSDRSPEDAPADVPDGHRTVWSATFDVSRTLGLPGPTHLAGPVELSAQGGYRAVERLREGLAEAFAVSVVGSASGDQEEEVRFHLENR
jgi:hypothetical protein